MACAWGCAGIWLGTNIKLPCLGDTVLWEAEMKPSGNSWVTTYFSEHEDTNDSPCVPLNLYVLSLHWSLMTITSIGYGDIGATRQEEYILTCVCMVIGSLTWASIIGIACSLFSTIDPFTLELERTMGELSSLAKDKQLEPDLRHRLREYFCNAHHTNRSMRYTELLTQLSPSLRGEVAMICSLFHDCSFFASLSQGLIVALSLRLIHRLYTPSEPIEGVALYICQRGLAAREGRVFCTGSYWGEDFILNSPHLINLTPANALTYCELAILTRSILDPLLLQYPADQKIVRRNQVRFTVSKGLLRMVRNMRRELARIRQERDSGTSVDDGSVPLLNVTSAAELALWNKYFGHHGEEPQPNLNNYKKFNASASSMSLPSYGCSTNAAFHHRSAAEEDINAAERATKSATLLSFGRATTVGGGCTPPRSLQTRGLAFEATEDNDSEQQEVFFRDDIVRRPSTTTRRRCSSIYGHPHGAGARAQGQRLLRLPAGRILGGPQNSVENPRVGVGGPTTSRMVGGDVTSSGSSTMGGLASCDEVVRVVNSETSRPSVKSWRVLHEEIPTSKQLATYASLDTIQSNVDAVMETQMKLLELVADISERIGPAPVS